MTKQDREVQTEEVGDWMEQAWSAGWREEYGMDTFPMITAIYIGSISFWAGVFFYHCFSRKP